MHKYFEPTGTVEEKGGPMVKYHESSFDGSSQPYALYIPSSYTPEKRWPLVISLHGFSSDHVLNLRRVFGMGNAPGEQDDTCKQHFPQFPEVDFIVASPYGFGSTGYAAMGEVDALDVLEDVKQHYSIDDDRIYLTGLSMGGEGTWHLGLRYPHIWAAISPVCGCTGVFIGPENVRCFTMNALDLPVYASHGGSDPVVPPECSRDMVALLKQHGAQAEHEEFPGVEHNAWDFTYANARIFDWFSQFRRVEKPSHVVYVTDRLRYSRSYWVEITRIRAWDSMSKIEARVEANSISVDTQNITAFSLHLVNAPVDLSQPVTVTCNGDEVFNGPYPEDGIVRIELSPAPEGRLLKRIGLEGPVFDAFRSKVAVVYGTQTDDPETRNSLECLAMQAAFLSDWADVEIPVLADTQVGDDEIRAMNLVLVGDEKTNSLIGRINASLPIRFTPNGVSVGDREIEGDLGLVEVYPNPLNEEKYVVVLGGRTEDTISRVTSIYRDMPDYAVYDADMEISKPETFKAYGYFDGKWELP